VPKAAVICHEWVSIKYDDQICRYFRRAVSSVGVIIFDDVCHFRPIRLSSGICRVAVGICMVHKLFS
jgi:hypothetical protein